MRDVEQAARRLLGATDASIEEIAKRDPDMIRDVAAAVADRGEHDAKRDARAEANKLFRMAKGL